MLKPFGGLSGEAMVACFFWGKPVVFAHLYLHIKNSEQNCPLFSDEKV